MLAHVLSATSYLEKLPGPELKNSFNPVFIRFLIIFSRLYLDNLLVMFG